MSIDLAQPPIRRRPWWRVRLSLRTLMIVVLVIGFPLGWKARRASIQRRAVAAVQALGGRVCYEDEIDPRGFAVRPHQPWGPLWLRRLVGDELFQEVAGIACYDLVQERCRFDDESIAVIADFDRLQGLVITIADPEVGTQPARPITSRGLAQLTSLSRLRFLTLNFVGPDAAMMSLLPHWPALEEVVILERQDLAPILPGSSLAYLGALPRLKHVVVNSVAADRAEDLVPLTKLKHLERVLIHRAALDDATSHTLGAMSALHDLELPSTRLTAANLAAVAQNPNLQSLDFDGADLPAGGLRALTSFRRLNTLNVRRDRQTAFPYLPLAPLDPPLFGDEDLDALHDVPLRDLSLAGLDATDAGVARLCQSHTFHSLALGGRGVTDASIPLLVQQTGLVGLALTDTSITDAGLARLAALTRLQYLSLINNTALTDAGVAVLRSFPTLDRLTIHQPAVQPATLDAIRAARSKFGPFTFFQPSEEAVR